MARRDSAVVGAAPVTNPRALLVLAVWTVLVSLAACAPLERETLTARQLETPRFDPPPPPTGTALGELRQDLTGEPGRSLLTKFVPSQGAVLVIALLVMLVIGIDWNHLRHPRNLELLALLPIGFLLFDCMRYFELFQDPIYWRLMDAVFIAIMAVSVLLLTRALIRMQRPHSEPWRPYLPKNALMVIALALLGLNVMTALLRQPDDVGFYTNLGAQRLRERAMFPYGDPLLTNTPGATYSPILYFSHLAYQVLLGPVQNPPDPKPEFGVYVLPPMLASQLATTTFHIAGVLGLLIAARRLIGAHAAWGVVALYCGSAYVMGVGGERDMINGMVFASHIAPAAVTLLAFAVLPWPWASGALLATAAWTLFYPAFFFPAWAGYYSRSRSRLVAFVGGFAIAGLVIGVPVLLRSQPIEGRGLIGTILHETQGHQQDPNAYGSSPFGFWGQRGGIRAMLRDPLVPEQPNTAPAFLLFAAFVVGAFFLARHRTELQLALLTGALGIASQLWKIHGTGVYVTWYYGFLLLGFLAHQTRSAAEPQTDIKMPSP
jgi:hypothetical protein